MGKFFSDFKKFISKGNVMDMAVGVVIGGAFGKITTSLVNDIIMPLISLLTGGKSVVDWKWVIRPAVIENGVVVMAESALKYGLFIQTILDFLIIAFCIFLVLRLIMKAQAGIASMGKSLSVYTKKEKRELLKSGKSASEILAIEKEREEALLKQKKEEEQRKKDEEKANSTEVLLKEIRDLLKEQAATNKE